MPLITRKSTSKHPRKRLLSGKLLLLLVLVPVLGVVWLKLEVPRPSQLEQIEQRGVLRMITRNGATAYYLGPDGPTGLEYELVSRFAEYLGVEVEVTLAEQFQQLFPMLENGEGDLVAANITRTPERSRQLRFGPDFDQVRAEVIYRRGGEKPDSVADLLGNRVVVLAGSSYEDILREAQAEHPELRWKTIDEGGIEDLFEAVSSGLIDYTLVDSSVYRINRRYFPLIRRAFSMGQPQPLAWVFPSGDDDSLLQKAREFFALQEQSDAIDELLTSWFEGADDFDPVGMFTFMQQVQDRLPALLPIFTDAANAHDLDWRLLAAMGYQESHWDPDAVSRTGVRGIMMLTQRTADSLGVTDRRDPAQSIEGGARYLKRMLATIPDRIPMPDRLWMALAAYNIGYGHLEDARVLAERNGGDADRWPDVKQALPLLTQEKWYRQTRHGYARGFEASRYVENVRSYYETLSWMDTHGHPLLTADTGLSSSDLGFTAP